MSTYDPFYLSCFEIKLFTFRCHMGLPGETSVEVNAWLTSKKTAEQYLCSSNALLIMFAMRWHCCIVEWALRKPNW